MATKLLAGPILRRTTTHRICVWLATAHPILLRLTITDLRGNLLGQSILKNLDTQCVQLGRNLYIYLLQARPKIDNEFPRDTLLYYSLEEIDTDKKVQSLDLSDFAYDSFLYPTFFIPTQLKQILHGSCRKPHGGFDQKNQKTIPDALSYGDDLLGKTHSNLEQRPALLLLTGDQIYADEVAISLLAMLRQQALTLIGKQETLPLADDPLLSRLDPSTILLHERKQVLKKKHPIASDSTDKRTSGFSSDESENHLFTFGEFAAMYIYAFGNQPAWEPVWDWSQLKDLGVSNSEEAIKAHGNQKAPLNSYHKTLFKVRKLLANIPTYMIFDDHDVTDDWNITGSWYDGVRESPLGRRIVSNALAAYWAFQGWGNDPDNFDKDLILTITQHLNDDSDHGDIGERYDLHTWKSRGWGFSVPTDPPIIAMDSRTQRQYENKYYPAMLMDRYALDWLRVEWAKLKTGQEIINYTCPVLIAATPVMGFSTIELFQQVFLWLAGLFESWKPIQNLEKLCDRNGMVTGWLVSELDAESWSCNKDGFVRLLDTICRHMEIQQCVFLSGDVHYAFTAKADFKYQGRRLQCYQLTSSALSNEPGAKQSGSLGDAAKHQSGIKSHRNWAPLPGQRWVVEVELLKAEKTDLRVTPECNLGLVAFANGLPIKHTLLIGENNQLIFYLPSLALRRTITTQRKENH